MPREKHFCSSKLEHQSWFVRIFERDCSCKREIINKAATTMELSLSRARGVRVVHCHGSQSPTLSKMTVYCKTLTINETLHPYSFTIYLVITVHSEFVLYIVYYSVKKTQEIITNCCSNIYKTLQYVQIPCVYGKIQSCGLTLRPPTPLYNSSCSAHVSEW